MKINGHLWLCLCPINNDIIKQQKRIMYIINNIKN